jgi:putative membrane-bound dehydrogenase-like protein
MKFFTFVLIVVSGLGVAGASGGNVRPAGGDGKPLNLNFESGTLGDWTATGDAFVKQPIKGDVVATRRKDMRSEHEGEYWIGGFEAAGDDGTGTLTSRAFKVSQPWASFLVAGGDWATTYVEVVDAGSGKPIVTARGSQSENLRRVIVDLRKFLGKQIFVRIVDQQRGHWGHVNFDDFVFHDAEPKFASVAANPPPVSSAPAATPGPVDDVKFAGLTPEQAAKEMTLPEGFSATVFAAEPDVVQPIAFCVDDRGRLWVVEGLTYPNRAKEGEGQDRILILEDTDGDGKSDRRTVFMEGLNLVSGIEVGFGGVFIGAAPQFLFVKVDNWDAPKPAGKPEVLLDGWGYEDTHETLNTFTWGPDGWLYGCHGVFTHSKVGRPGTPDDQRTKINAGIWRFHPQKRQFEVFAHGTSNPWGIDFDENGQCFVEACVIPHLFHIIQGARYQRQAGPHFNPHTYDDIKTIADHRHYVGATPHAGNNKSASAGGGHAHAGMLIYQAESWPEAFRGKMFMNNIHGQRLNMDIPVPHGSGFIGKHGADFCNFNDRWSQVVNLLSSPDGSMYAIDWYDKQQCHDAKPDKHDRSNGRIFKIAFNAHKTPPVDLTKKSDAELAALVTDRNEWMARHARRILQERASKSIAGPLEKAVREAKPREALRGLWTLHVTANLSEATILECLRERADNPYLTGWAIQFACENGKPSEAVRKQMTELARSAKSPVIRLYLASAAPRLPIDQRAAIVEPLIAHGEDATDQNLPLMYWYALEPLVAQNPAAAATMLGASKIPILQEYIARRMAATAQLSQQSF